MTTGSLDRWFSSKPVEIPTFFYQNWSNPDGISPAVWLTDPPRSDQINFQRKVIWPEMRKEIIICGYFPEDSEVRIPEEQKYQNVSLLKSHLQKCIRRQVTEPAVQTAYHLIKMDPESLFRRLTIIALEDVCLLESYGTLVWLTLANLAPHSSDKQSRTEFNFYWTLPVIEWTLSVVRQLSEFRYFDNMETPPRSRFNFQNNLSKIQKNLNSNDQALLYAMKLRRDLISSMPGEQVMQDQKIHLWYLRFINAKAESLQNPSSLDPKTESLQNQKFLDLVYQPLNWNSMIPRPLKLKDWILPGIDFHCFPMIVDWTIQKFPELKAKEIKMAIWYKRSSLNTRRYLGPKPEDKPEVEVVWRKIRYSVEKNSIYILKNYH